MSASRANGVAAYWDANKQKSTDPTFWMAHPLCRQRINQRISGSPHEWPLDWFKRVHCKQPFKLGISWGSGLGAFERAAIRCGAVREIDAFDISPSSLEDARRIARDEGIQGINYQVGNFDDPEIAPRKYDIVFFQQSLHHVAALERLFRRLALALRPRAVFYLDEFVGPSRTDWKTEHLTLAQALLKMAPADARVRDELTFPIEVNDPSEGVRSSEIEPFARDFCEILDWRPYGGQILDLVIPCLKWDWAMSPEGFEYVRALLDIEDRELDRDATTSHHAVAVGRLKPLYRLTRPLGRQAFAAAKRRIARLRNR
ncbi:MAG TPA: class I SAM-dependent methyltransferase [Thermoanaerobaculia bacterium]